TDYDDAGGDAGSLGWLAVSTATTDPGTWTFSGSSVPVWANDTTYLVKVRAQDNALNFSAPIASYTFTYDNVAPAATITLPVGEPTVPRVSSLPTISGTASDTTNSNINYVELRIRNNDQSQYYDPIGS